MTSKEVPQFRLICVESTDEDVLAGTICVQRAKEIGIELKLDPLTPPRSATLVRRGGAELDIFIWAGTQGLPTPIT